MAGAGPGYRRLWTSDMTYRQQRPTLGSGAGKPKDKGQQWYLAELGMRSELQGSSAKKRLQKTQIFKERRLSVRKKLHDQTKRLCMCTCAYVHVCVCACMQARSNPASEIAPSNLLPVPSSCGTTVLGSVPGSETFLGFTEKPWAPSALPARSRANHVVGISKWVTWCDTHSWDVLKLIALWLTEIHHMWGLCKN